MAHGFRVLGSRSLGPVAFMAMVRERFMVGVWVEKNSSLHGSQEPKRGGERTRVSLRMCFKDLFLVIHCLKLSEPSNSTTGLSTPGPMKNIQDPNCSVQVSWTHELRSGCSLTPEANWQELNLWAEEGLGANRICSRCPKRKFPSKRLDQLEELSGGANRDDSCPL